MPITNVKKFSREGNGDLSDLVTLGNWTKGIINRQGTNIPEDALLDALNVDITNQGVARSRKGRKKILDGLCHSAFTFNKEIYFCKNSNLCKINKNKVVTTLIENFSSTKVNYLEVAGELYIASSFKTFKITRTGNLEPWGISSPQEPCSIVIGSPNSGIFKKGLYRISYSYLFDSYETGVFPQDTIIDVGHDNFDLTLSCEPSIHSTSAVFYISSINGTQLYEVGTGYEVTVNSIDVMTSMPKIHSEAMPPLENLSFANGRIWGTKDSFIVFSNDRDYRQCNPLLYIGVDNTKIQLFKAVDTGLYIVTELATYFMSVTNPEDVNSMQLTKILPYSGIKGTMFVDTDSNSVGWLSTEGYILGDFTGKVENLTKNTIDFSKNYSEGCSLFRKKDGVVQVLFALNEIGEKSSFQTHSKNNQV
jgi:hypothetical protein